MPLDLPTPIIYLITSGEAANENPADETCARLLSLIAAAVAARIPLIQLREKSLSARALYQLTRRAVQLTQHSSTRLLVNDRADIARAAGASGVHLTTRSIDTSVVRRAFGPDFLIAVSTHTLEEACVARDGGADLVTFGPVFDTPSKNIYGPPVGLTSLREASRALAPFPIIALGGITRDNAVEALRAGAHGFAAIRALSDPTQLEATVRAVRGAP